MSLILVDTSVWIDFFQGRPTREAEVLGALLQDDSSIICICPIILQEILQGIGNDEVFNQVSDSLQHQVMLACPPAEAAVGAAQLYRKLRKAVTIRKSNDCLIAYHAIFYEAELLQCDRDFQLMVPHTGLKLYSFKSRE